MGRIGQVWLVFAGFVGLLAFLYFGWRSATKKYTDQLKTQSRRVFCRYSYFQPEARLASTRVFIMSSLVDEAYSVLVGSWWMHRMTGWGVRLGISAAIALSLVVNAAFWYGASLLLEALFGNAVYELQDPILSIIELIAVAICFTFLIGSAYVLVHLFLLISGRSSPGLGLGDPGDNLVCGVDARQSLPAPIQATNKRYGVWQLIWHAKGALFHSRIYAYPPAIKDIAEWMSTPMGGIRI